MSHLTRDILTSWYSKFTSTSTGAHTSLYTSLNGRMYLSEAPQNVVLPYAVYEIIDDRQDWQFGKNYRRITIALDEYSSVLSTTEITTIMGQTDDLYDHCKLTSTGFSHGACNREFSNLSKLIDDVSGTPIWWALHQYQITISHT